MNNYLVTIYTDNVTIKVFQQAENDTQARECAIKAVVDAYEVEDRECVLRTTCMRLLSGFIIEID